MNINLIVTRLLKQLVQILLEDFGINHFNLKEEDGLLGDLVESDKCGNVVMFWNYKLMEMHSKLNIKSFLEEILLMMNLLKKDISKKFLMV